MDLKTELLGRMEQALDKYLAAVGVAREATSVALGVEAPRNREHGDYASNIAMQLTRVLKRPPMQVAEEFLMHLEKDGLIREATIAKPGFINFRLESAASAAVLTRIAEQGANYGKTNMGKGFKVLIEFVSANPTGPLHIGHARNAVVGDTLARVMAAAGFNVSREYYFNDAGVQMNMLGNTLRLRVDELLGREVQMPADKVDPETGESHAQFYKGQYMIEIAEKLLGELGKEEASQAHEGSFYTEYAVREILKTIDYDMKSMGIEFDTWFSETSLHRNGEVEATLEELRKLGKIYEQDGASWLRTTEYGDEKDRVVIKSDGNYTYVMPDIAYHRDKYGRGYDRLINVLGGDHHGYVPRLTAAVAALGHPKEALNCVIIQMVSLLKDGVSMKLSTRSGEFLTLKEMADELSIGVVRWFFAMRSPDSQMVFDWSLAKDTSMDNPVYYVQYAHARCCSLFRKAEEAGCPYAGIANVDLSLMTHPAEVAILQELERLSLAIEASATDLSAHHVTNYLQGLAQLFHNLFTLGMHDASLRFILPDNPALTQARLAMIDGLRTVLANGLQVLGIPPMERM
jgi:arginyl-tRNA synthetase